MYKAYLIVACCTWDLCAYHILSLTVYIRVISCACAVVVVIPKWPFITMSIFACPAEHGLSRAPADLHRPRDAATPDPHSSPRCRCEGRGANAKLRERGASKGALPGTGCSVHQCNWQSRMRGQPSSRGRVDAARGHHQAARSRR